MEWILLGVWRLLVWVHICWVGGTIGSETVEVDGNIDIYIVFLLSVVIVTNNLIRGEHVRPLYGCLAWKYSI
jgi:hypothetical protein